MKCVILLAASQTVLLLFTLIRHINIGHMLILLRLVLTKYYNTQSLRLLIITATLNTRAVDNCPT